MIGGLKALECSDLISELFALRSARSSRRLCRAFPSLSEMLNTKLAEH